MNLLIPSLPDEAFERGNVPMTKALVRHECVRLLGLKEGDVLFDIGSGTGSVAIEASCLSPSVQVFSIEKKPEAAELQRRNIQKLAGENITLVQGTAPEALTGLPAPDAVFLGGTTGRLQEILQVLRGYGKAIRVVATAVSLQTIAQFATLAEEPCVSELQLQQVSCAPVRSLGRYQLLQAENPVMIAAFVLLPGGEEA